MGWIFHKRLQTQRTDLRDGGQTRTLLQHGDDFLHVGLHPGQVLMLHLCSRPVTRDSSDSLSGGLGPTEVISRVCDYLSVGLLAMLLTLEEMR